jgi:hypothetical protein
VQPHLRIALAEAAQQPRQLGRPEIVGHRQAELALQRFAAQVAQRLVGERQKALRMSQKPRAGNRGRHAGLAARQQRLPGALLELAHLLADSGLRQEHLRRGRGEAARLDDGDEGPELLQVEGLHGSIHPKNR